MKTIYIITASLAAFAAANAQSYVAGWDFQSAGGSAVLADGYNSDRNIGTADAIITSSDFNFIANNGVGDTTINGTAFWQANGFDGGNLGDNSTGTRGIFINDGGSLEIAFNATNSTNTAFSMMWDVAVLGTFGTEQTVPFTFYSDVFTVDLFNGNSLLSGDILAANDFNGGYNTDIEEVDVSLLDGVSNARIVITANANLPLNPGENLTLDNFAVSGTGFISPVPEPSAFAAIAGALALAFVGARRRRK